MRQTPAVMIELAFTEGEARELVAEIAELYLAVQPDDLSRLKLLNRLSNQLILKLVASRR